MSRSRNIEDLEAHDLGLPHGRAHLWVGGLVAAVALGGMALTVVMVNETDAMANHSLAVAHAAETSAP